MQKTCCCFGSSSVDVFVHKRVGRSFDCVPPGFALCGGKFQVCVHSTLMVPPRISLGKPRRSQGAFNKQKNIRII